MCADAALHQAEANSQAAKAEAEGKKALNEAQLLLYNNSSYVELEKARLEVEVARYTSRKQVPAVYLGDNGNTAAPLFFQKGKELIDFALLQQQQKKHVSEDEEKEIKKMVL